MVLTGVKQVFENHQKGSIAASKSKAQQNSQKSLIKPLQITYEKFF
jgi:hypothetical protein